MHGNSNILKKPKIDGLGLKSAVADFETGVRSNGRVDCLPITTPLDLTSELGFATEVGRLPQQTGCLRTLKYPVRVRGQFSNWSGTKTTTTTAFLSDVPVLVKQGSSRYICCSSLCSWRCCGHSWCRGWLLPCTEQFHTVYGGFGDTDLLTFCCEFVNVLGTTNTESSILQTA